MHRVLRDVVRIIVGRAKAQPRPDPGSRQPNRETTRVMIPAIIIDGEFTLRITTTSEFSAPDNKSIFE